MADTASLAHLNWDGSVLMDREHYLHDGTGSSACLYLVRPDWYVGFRGKAADQNCLLAYFKDIQVMLSICCSFLN